MKKSEFDKDQLRISVTAGMNQRFHQDRARHWSRLNRGVQISVGILAVAGLCFSVAAVFAKSTCLDVVSVAVATLAAIMAIILNVIPLSDWAQDHRNLFGRWTDIREDIDSMLFDVGDKDTIELHDVQRLKQLDSKVHRACGAETGLSSSDLELFKKFEAAEKKSRPNCAPC